jgi:hypothetical protein
LREGNAIALGEIAALRGKGDSGNGGVAKG